MGLSVQQQPCFSASLMPALNAQSAILDICREFSESRPNRKVVPSTPRLSFWTVLFRHNQQWKGLLPAASTFPVEHALNSNATELGRFN